MDKTPFPKQVLFTFYMVRLFPLVRNKTPSPKQGKFTSYMIHLQSHIVNVRIKPWAGTGPKIPPIYRGYTAWTPTQFLSPFQEFSQLFQ